jgi:hypothetical protein
MHLYNTTPPDTKDVQTNSEFFVKNIKLIEDLANHNPFFQRFCEATPELTSEQRVDFLNNLKPVLAHVNNHFVDSNLNEPRNPNIVTSSWTERRFYESLFYTFYNFQNYINSSNLSINYEFDLLELIDIDSYKNRIENKEGLYNLVLISKVSPNATYESSIRSFPFAPNGIVNNREQQTTDTFSSVLKSFIENVIDVSLNFTSLFKIADAEETIYSTLNNNFCNNFKLDELPLLNDKFVSQPIYNQRRVYFKTQRYNGDVLDQSFFTPKEAPPIGLNYRHRTRNSLNSELAANKLISLETFNSYDSDTIDILFPEEKNAFQVYHIPSWESSSAKTSEFKTVTRKFLSKRKGLFVPILTKCKAVDENNQINDIQILSLINFTSKTHGFNNNLSHYKLMSKSFLEFIEMYSFENGLFFKNPEEALQKYNDRFKTVLNYSLKDNSFMTPQIKNYLDYHLRVVTPIKHSFDSLKTVFNLENTKAISFTYKKDPILVKKQNKIKLKFSKLKTKILNQRQTYTNLNAFIIGNIKKLKEEYKLASLLQTNVIKTSPIDLNFYSSYTKLNTVSQKIEESILQDKKNKINSNSLELDPFFLNLKQNNIHLLSIEYLNSKKETVTLDKESFKADNFVFSQDDVVSYQEVKFIIDEPCAIYVDSKSKPKAVKVGGPYIVKVSPESLKIKLKDKDSFFGLTGTNNMLVHPHAGAISTARIFKDYTNACLGEAAPLLFSAFKNVNLKLIILSAMTWVNSANSADTWGRRYNSFMDYDLFDFSTSEDSPQEECIQEDNLTKNETENIISILNDTIEDQELQEEGLDQPQPVTRFSEEEFTATPETYVSYSARPSLWSN